MMIGTGETPDSSDRTVFGLQSDDVYVEGRFVAAPAASDEQHLLDSDLGTALSGASLKHLADCGWCGRRQAMAHESLDPAEEEAFLRAARTRVRDSIKGFQALTRLGPGLRALMDESYDRGDVEPGQIWRLRHGSSTAVGVILDIEHWWVTVAPVTTDIVAADEYSLLVGDMATVLGVPAALCISLECVVPLITLDRLVTPSTKTRLADNAGQLPRVEDVRRVWLAWRRGDVPPVGFSYGQPVIDGDLDRRELRSAVAADFEPMIGARARLASAVDRPEGPSLSDRLRALGRPPSELAHETGLQQEVFKRIGQNKRITREEATALAPILQTDPGSVFAANPPLSEGLRREIMKPRWRPSLRLLASQHKPPVDEDSEREKTAEAVAVLAARPISGAASGGVRGGEVDWPSMIELYLGTRLAERGESIPGVDAPPRLEH
jgi:hypothetical protein